MISNFTEKHATLPETSLLRFICAYIEFIDLQEPVYKTGRPRIQLCVLVHNIGFYVSFATSLRGFSLFEEKAYTE
ncbi:hypothetical protein P4S83_13320 [Aneurinibacillus thermoaerophilus]|uniref:hypothetical protein n=1 Tax=Aneurinibacillus thermoaerophilus TaxID=143495 RepID=UPI002E227D25|nr:hypothetical protein [Aneurinibacillus thermoaerophilus]MED0766089.1 hypothetical protein [Aneurinibacillus thermoaerophilus]